MKNLNSSLMINIWRITRDAFYWFEILMRNKTRKNLILENITETVILCSESQP